MTKSNAQTAPFGGPSPKFSELETLLTQWEAAFHDALHSIRSLLCAAISCMPYEKTNQRILCISLDNGFWSRLLKRMDRCSKFDPLIEKVDLINCNPQYAHIKLSNGKKTSLYEDWLRRAMFQQQNYSPILSQKSLPPNHRQNLIPWVIWRSMLETSQTHWRSSTLYSTLFPTYSHDNKVLMRAVCETELLKSTDSIHSENTFFMDTPVN